MIDSGRYLRTVPDLDGILLDAAGSAPVPGLAVAVFDRLSTIATLVRGVADLDSGRQADEDTWWDLSGLTSVLVTLPEVLDLVESGRLGLDQTLGNAWPRSVAAPVGAATIGQLLSFDAGLPWWRPYFHTARGADEVIREVLDTRLTGRPGAGAHHTEIGFLLLGAVVEDFAGTSLEALAPRRGELRFDPPRDRTAATEFCGWRHRLVVGEVHDENAAAMGGMAGHAGAFGTLAGTVEAARAAFGTHPGTATNPWSTNADGDRFGLGWWLAPTGGIGGPVPGPDGFGATGFVGNRLWYEPTHGYAVLVLSNRIHPRRSEVAAFNEWHASLLAAIAKVLR
jgi:CubicO group peptidase (beta-lactamase class C family)